VILVKVEEQRTGVEAGGEVDRHPGTEQEVAGHPAQQPGCASDRRRARGIDEQVGARGGPDGQDPAGMIPALGRRLPAELQGEIGQPDRLIPRRFALLQTQPPAHSPHRN